MTLDELIRLAASVGFQNPALAAAVAEAESRGNPGATNIVTNPAPGNGPERSFGLWQINVLAHPQYDEASLLQPDYNARAAYAVSSQGTNWNPWSTYVSGAYRKYYAPIAPPIAVLVAAAAILAAGVGVAYTITRPPKWLKRLL